MGTTYDIADRVRATVKFTSSTSSVVGVVPGGIRFHLESPAGAVTSNTLATSTTIKKHTTSASTGTAYYRDITTTSSGIYEIRWTSTGNYATSVEQWFNVRARRVTT